MGRGMSQRKSLSTCEHHHCTVVVPLLCHRCSITVPWLSHRYTQHLQCTPVTLTLALGMSMARGSTLKGPAHSDMQVTCCVPLFEML